MLLTTINSFTLIIALPDLERSLGTSMLQLVWVILSRPAREPGVDTGLERIAA